MTRRRDIEALAAVLVEYNHLARPTATFMAVLTLHGEQEARRREALCSSAAQPERMPSRRR
jgi:hypothetical protein